MTVIIDGTAGITFPNSTTQAVAGAPLTTPSFTTTIGVGAATASASGSGITFPATQSASSDANTLDDYEEGTWTPSYLPSGSGSITHNTQVGRYIKIGQSVFCTVEISTNSVTSLTGNMQISGLPFTSRSGIYAGSISVGYISAFNTIGPVRGYVNQNNTTGYLVAPVSATADSELPASSMRNATGANYLIATISYLTAN